MLAIIDIGSNSIRLAVFQRQGRNLQSLYNEKLMCGLGRTLGATGKLDPLGVKQAQAGLARFAQLLRAYKVKQLIAVATAAVRDASDGPQFLADIQRHTGLRINILSGGGEALASAQGVLYDWPQAQGLMADCGGGSVELVRLQQGRPRQEKSLALGPLRLLTVAGKNRVKARAHIKNSLKTLPWLAAASGQDFYAVGGSWRALAKLHMQEHNYPLPLVAGYRVPAAQMLAFAEKTLRRSPSNLDKEKKIGRKRAASVPYATMVLAEILRASGAAAVVFSGTGLREGLAFQRMPKNLRKLDPLIDYVRHMPARPQERQRRGLAKWLMQHHQFWPSFDERLLQAVALASDAAWQAHPDYRADQILNAMLHAPCGGFSHSERALLALALHTRYAGADHCPEAAIAKKLLSVRQQRCALALGAALRLIYSLTGGALGLISSMAIKQKGRTLALILPAQLKPLIDEVLQRRLTALALALGLNAEIASLKANA